MTGICHYERTIQASRETVWGILTNCRKWGEISALADWFGRVEWFEGEPWKVGSRILIEHYWPTQRDVRLVLVTFKAPEEFAWIGHGNNVTAHQQIRLEAINQRTCRLTSSMSFATLGNGVPSKEVDAMAERLLRTFLDAVAGHSEAALAKTRKAG